MLFASCHFCRGRAHGAQVGVWHDLLREFPKGVAVLLGSLRGNLQGAFSIRVVGRQQDSPVGFHRQDAVTSRMPRAAADTTSSSRSALARSISRNALRWDTLNPHIHCQAWDRQEEHMKYGARNKIEGNVQRIKKGDLMAQVDVDVPVRVVLSSVMTIDSLKELKLKKGDRVRVIVKAIHVLLVKE